MAIVLLLIPFKYLRITQQSLWACSDCLVIDRLMQKTTGNWGKKGEIEGKGNKNDNVDAQKKRMHDDIKE